MSSVDESPMDLPSVSREKKMADVEIGNGKINREGEEGDSIELGIRSSVPSFDKDVPASTFRSWTLGILFTMICNGLNQLFTMHNPPLVISPLVIVIVSYPIGYFLSWTLPTHVFRLFGTEFTLNPGPFNHKEHTVITLMVIGTSSFNSNATAADVYTAFIKYLGLGAKVTTGYKLVFMLTTQGLGFGLGSIFQRVLVDPAYCVWPAILPTCTLIHGFHDGSFFNFSVPGWPMSRMKFFWIVLIFATIYQFVPSYLFTALSTFAWVTYIAPNNVVVNQVFGSRSGMDLIPLTFDWNQITAYLTSPLPVPMWAIVNLGAASVFFLWILAPAVHWSNVWYGLYVPFSSSAIYDNTGSSYNVSKVLTPQLTLNQAAYHEYSPIFLSTTTVLSYGLGLGSVVSILVHTFLVHRHEVWQGLKKIFKFSTTDPAMDAEDIHVEMMKKYKRTPTWWYAVSYVAFIGLAIGFVESYNTGVSWWFIIVAMIIQLVTVIPIGIMGALCNQTVSLSVLGDFMGGGLYAGNMEAAVIAKVLLYVPVATATVLLRDQKLGHYMKVPPRVVFVAQALGIIVSWITQTGVNAWALGNIEGICTTSHVYICPIARSFESSIVFWGLIGPSTLFGPGSLYSSILYFLIAGAIFPVIIYFLTKKFPTSWIKDIHVPLVMSATSSIPPATAINFIPWTIVGVAFNWLIRTRHTFWWLKYNYMLSAGLDAGLGLCTFLIFFCLYYPGVTLNWWGNVQAFETADVAGLPLRSVGVNETFGPLTWR